MNLTTVVSVERRLMSSPVLCESKNPVSCAITDRNIFFLSAAVILSSATFRALEEEFSTTRNETEVGVKNRGRGKY
tara:strand:+ start:366 stop:593 length:228 start_codon:yes stop_codon:yes gene_type:complete